MILRSAVIRPDQTGHEAGRELLEKMYRELLQEPMPPIAVTERGKPYFTEGDLYFSISHTPRRVFCALAENPVGIDAEELDRKVNLRLADRILSPKEREQYEAAEDKRIALLIFWVLHASWILSAVINSTTLSRAWIIMCSNATYCRPSAHMIDTSPMCSILE